MRVCVRVLRVLTRVLVRSRVCVRVQKAEEAASLSAADAPQSRAPGAPAEEDNTAALTAKLEGACTERR
jgi:hypothetical protein